ncbi:uncharacterized protein LOC122661844 [Telopea speciosissima]|uniref:uncharacterized protein LOC122661844 n=1 Tax=Telopea speciosissima TaxID=54955 RepID=UPI001CC79B38|nr:uncharacterized protein LOC122661844 [Telopea speciosissima]
MESDDEYDLFSPLEGSPSPIPPSKFKRLKKAVRVSNQKRALEEQTNLVSAVDFLGGVDTESSQTLHGGTSVDPTAVALEPEGFDDQEDLDSGSDGVDIKSSKTLDIGKSVDPTPVALEPEGFDDQMDDRSEPLRTFDAGEGSYLGASDADIEEVDEKGDERSTGSGEEIGGEKPLEMNMVKSLKKRPSMGGSKEKKNKKAKTVGDAGKSEASTRAKRGLEKERNALLGELHAESQRILRETRNASFKPVLLVHKPISSILEKIRQRKLEVSKKACYMNSYEILADATDYSRDSTLGPNTKRVKSDAGEKGVNVESSLDADHASRSIDHMTLSGQCEHILHDVGTATHLTNAGGSLDSGHMSEEGLTPSGQCENTLHTAALDEGSTHAFRPPVNDTQDIFCESQPCDGDDEQPMSQSASPLEEALASSVVPMNLKLDSVPDDLSDDDEDDNKENIEPYPRKQVTVCLSPKGDPVKAFVDEEAEVEDDSDNDLMRFQENEEDGENEDEELNDLIVRGYREKPIDGEMRNQLHQKWLEQQDANETDNVLQRLKGGWKQREPIMLEDEEEDEEFGEDSLDGVPDDLLPSNVVKANSKKLKQMIPEMFTDKDDVFLSSDDEETEQSLHKQRLLEKIEDQASFLSPAEDESSREVFGLIKKLNIAPETKKKPKASSSFDMLVTGGNRNNSSKSSFLGRAPSISSSSSHKHGSSTSRSFIFGRDDSNSRSGISSSEVSSDIGLKEKQSTTNASAKYSSSQSKSSWQSVRTVTETVSGSSLFEILRRSSMESDHSSRNNLVGQTQTVFAAFKSGKKAIKIEGRT